MHDAALSPPSVRPALAGPALRTGTSPPVTARGAAPPSSSARGEAVRPLSPGPGLAKARPRALTWSAPRCASLSPDFWQRLIEGAEVVSEGEVVEEAERAVYYGTTSVVCELAGSVRDACGAVNLGWSAEHALALFGGVDPHVRLRLLRIARREAQSRAPRPLGVLHAELAVRLEGSRLCIAASVSAPLAPIAVRARRQP